MDMDMQDLQNKSKEELMQMAMDMNLGMDREDMEEMDKDELVREIMNKQGQGSGEQG